MKRPEPIDEIRRARPWCRGAVTRLLVAAGLPTAEADRWLSCYVLTLSGSGVVGAVRCLARHGFRRTVRDEALDRILACVESAEACPVSTPEMEFQLQHRGFGPRRPLREEGPG